MTCQLHDGWRQIRQIEAWRQIRRIGTNPTESPALLARDPGAPPVKQPKNTGKTKCFPPKTGPCTDAWIYVTITPVLGDSPHVLMTDDPPRTLQHLPPPRKRAPFRWRVPRAGDDFRSRKVAALYRIAKLGAFDPLATSARLGLGSGSGNRRTAESRRNDRAAVRRWKEQGGRNKKMKKMRRLRTSYTQFQQKHVRVLEVVGFILPGKSGNALVEKASPQTGSFQLYWVSFLWAMSIRQ